jgi:hypothetical protein
MGPAYLLRTVFVDLGGRLAPASVSVVLWICAVAGAISDRVRKHHAFVIPIFVAVQAAVALLSGGDWMTGWRYMTPVFALWMLLVVIGAKDIGRAIMGLRAGAVTSAAAGSAAVTALCGVLLWAGTEFRNPADGAVSWASKDWPTSVRGLLHGFRMQNTVTTADFLNGHVPAGSLLAFSEVGAVPYLTPELRWLDTYGLTDAEIAHSTGDRYRTGVTGDYTDSQSRAGKIVLQRRPDFIVRWISEDAQQGPILDGNYYPWMRTPVTSYDGPGRYVLQVWRRADRATRG